MKIRYLTLSLTLAVAACGLQAQQSMPEMPGMKMDTPPAKSQQTTQAPKPNRTRQQPDPMPDDMKNMRQDTRNTKAKAASASIEQSLHQQAGQSDGKPAQDSDASSIKLPIQELQEPEAVGFQTGSDLPAPELLVEVVRQQPMTFVEFIDMADKTNPTLVQAQRNVDRSKEQARQVSLPSQSNYWLLRRSHSWWQLSRRRRRSFLHAGVCIGSQARPAA